PLLIRPPSSSTLFPYTTLFRSSAFPRTARSTTLSGPTWPTFSRSRSLPQDRPDLPEVAGVEGRLADRQVQAPEALAPTQGQLGIDRKSTRLNSSHGSISYAVFC